ncbi:phage tail tape measure C-terminal domain-containing protein [Burkholderia sp. LMG 32019]|uniref:phage tail tape measure C-terminal domain-containing protein n=1 Tax=Burkholderia sp. LMG 32019 TaxID=3158173 RepID=UPI003C2B61CC
MFRRAFDSVSSALDTFITTGKASFSSFATSVLADLAKIALPCCYLNLLCKPPWLINAVHQCSWHRCTVIGRRAGIEPTDSIRCDLDNGNWSITAHVPIQPIWCKRPKRCSS